MKKSKGKNFLTKIGINFRNNFFQLLVLFHVQGNSFFARFCLLSWLVNVKFTEVNIRLSVKLVNLELQKKRFFFNRVQSLTFCISFKFKWTHSGPFHIPKRPWRFIRTIVWSVSTSSGLCWLFLFREVGINFRNNFFQFLVLFHAQGSPFFARFRLHTFLVNVIFTDVDIRLSFPLLNLEFWEIF